MIKNNFLAGTIITAVWAIAGCSSANDMLVKNSAIEAPASVQAPAPPEKTSLVYKPGEEATSGDFIVKINKVQDFEATGEFMRLADDMQLIVMEVEYKNHSGNPINANPLDWTATDNEGYSYRYDLMMAKEPMLNRKIIAPGGKAKGWITFQLSKKNKLTGVQFQPGLMETAILNFGL